jgi:hypothetical protein
MLDNEKSSKEYHRLKNGCGFTEDGNLPEH